LEELLKRLNEVENELDRKTDNNLFKNEIASLRELIGNKESDNSAHKKV
jgi:hypothetical protein